MESVHTGNRIAGSNPASSATDVIFPLTLSTFRPTGALSTHIPTHDNLSAPSERRRTIFRLSEWPREIALSSFRHPLLARALGLGHAEISELGNGRTVRPFFRPATAPSFFSLSHIRQQLTGASIGLHSRPRPRESTLAVFPLFSAAARWRQIAARIKKAGARGRRPGDGRHPFSRVVVSGSHYAVGF